jgi:membrane protease YdiL (CAAX protease family)
MESSPSKHESAEAQRPPLDTRQKAILAVLCIGAGILTFSAGSLPGSEVAKIAYQVVVTAVFLALALFTRKLAALSRFWELPFAFFVLSVFVVLDTTIPHYVGTSLLHDPPVPGNPLAGSIRGSVIIQLLETVIAIVVAVVLTKASGKDLGSIYLRVGTFGRAFVIGIAGLVLFSVLIGIILSGSYVPRLLPTHGTLTLSHSLALTPALLVLALSNGFLEELLYRGLFLKKYTAFFGPVLANVVQAVIFAYSHFGVSYTPSVLLFIVVFVFPLGLLTGYLMQSSKGILAGSLFHVGADMPIYLAFLSFVS